MEISEAHKMDRRLHQQDDEKQRNQSASLLHDLPALIFIQTLAFGKA